MAGSVSGGGQVVSGRKPIETEAQKLKSPVMTAEEKGTYAGYKRNSFLVGMESGSKDLHPETSARLDRFIENPRAPLNRDDIIFLRALTDRAAHGSARSDGKQDLCCKLLDVFKKNSMASSFSSKEMPNKKIVIDKGAKVKAQKEVAKNQAGSNAAGAARIFERPPVGMIPGPALDLGYGRDANGMGAQLAYVPVAQHGHVESLYTTTEAGNAIGAVSSLKNKISSIIPKRINEDMHEAALESIVQVLQHPEGVPFPDSFLKIAKEATQKVVGETSVARYFVNARDLAEHQLEALEKIAQSDTKDVYAVPGQLLVRAPGNGSGPAGPVALAPAAPSPFPPAIPVKFSADCTNAQANTFLMGKTPGEWFIRQSKDGESFVICVRTESGVVQAPLAAGKGPNEYAPGDVLNMVGGSDIPLRQRAIYKP